MAGSQGSLQGKTLPVPSCRWPGQTMGVTSLLQLGEGPAEGVLSAAGSTLQQSLDGRLLCGSIWESDPSVAPGLRTGDRRVHGVGTESGRHGIKCQTLHIPHEWPQAGDSPPEVCCLPCKTQLKLSPLRGSREN